MLRGIGQGLGFRTQEQGDGRAVAEGMVNGELRIAVLLLGGACHPLLDGCPFKRGWTW